MKPSLLCLTLATLSLGSAFAHASPAPTKPVISLAAAKAAVAATARLPQANKAPFVISVVDDGGHLIYLERADGVPSSMVEASILKARGAAGYGVSTKVLEQNAVQGHPGFLDLPASLPMEGGVPVRIDGQLIGAVGVAGGVSSDDGAFAEKTAAALASGG
ncbi:GlcG/HbpS family heme-binding protein [Pseudomonas sp. TE3610]